MVQPRESDISSSFRMDLCARAREIWKVACACVDYRSPHRTRGTLEALGNGRRMAETERDYRRPVRPRSEARHAVHDEAGGRRRIHRVVGHTRYVPQRIATEIDAEPVS